MKILTLLCIMPFISLEVSGQACCSGGSGSPIAGGTSQGVLYEGQAEAAVSFQYISSNVFLTGDVPAQNFLDHYSSQYIYSRLGYGISDKFTLSLELGYYPDRTQIGLEGRDKISASGFGDLVVFPRYMVYQDRGGGTESEITLGLGWKAPLGRYLDSSVSFTNMETGEQSFAPMPPSVMQSTGSHDIILYGFAYRAYMKSGFRIFSSALYVIRIFSSELFVR
jgi:hypothetical protein